MTFRLVSFPSYLASTARAARLALNLLRQGSSAEVFAGTFLESPVAIKLFHQLKKEEARKEIELLFELRHPNIVGILGFCHVLPSGQVGIVLELCSLGGLFPAYRQKWFTTAIGLRILWGCARALSYMHSFPVPIVHRDLKSGNILVTAEKVGKIADCGESRRVDFESTMTQIGTPMWAAPEVLRGKRYDEYVFWFCLLSRVSTATRPLVRLRKSMHWCSGKRNGHVSCCTVLT